MKGTQRRKRKGNGGKERWRRDWKGRKESCEEGQRMKGKGKQFIPHGKKVQLDSRLLLLLDIAYDGNENPEAFWDCYDE